MLTFDIHMSVREVTSRHGSEVQKGERFEFGRNWAKFLGTVTEERIEAAEESIKAMLQVCNLKGKRVLDIGSGSGLFSLAARRLEASAVHSFDYDPLSVTCTNQLRDRYFPNDPAWAVEQGSILDPSYVASLGTFDVVYSWGVLHHTGAMWSAIENSASCVKLGGQLFIAIYNDQGSISRYWAAIKRLYNRRPANRPILIALHAPYLVGARLVVRALTGRLRSERGMSFWYDMLDWLGGYPFEVASPAEITQFGSRLGFSVKLQKLCGRRHGCNQFVFDRAFGPSQQVTGRENG